MHEPRKKISSLFRQTPFTICCYRSFGDLLFPLSLSLPLSRSHKLSLSQTIRWRDTSLPLSHSLSHFLSLSLYLSLSLTFFITSTFLISLSPSLYICISLYSLLISFSLSIPSLLTCSLFLSRVASQLPKKEVFPVSLFQFVKARTTKYKTLLHVGQIRPLFRIFFISITNVLMFVVNRIKQSIATCCA